MTAKPNKTCLKAADALRAFVCTPQPQHWLMSDATLSYCWGCAWLARWFEMDRMGPPPPPEEQWSVQGDDAEEIADGIDGGNWYSAENDCPAFCAGCGQILKFHLTEHGVDYALEGFEPDSINLKTIRNPSEAYELRELLEAGASAKQPEMRKALIATAKATMAAIHEEQRAPR